MQNFLNATRKEKHKYLKGAADTELHVFSFPLRLLYSQNCFCWVKDGYFSRFLLRFCTAQINLISLSQVTKVAVPLANVPQTSHLVS